jgi:hypothetical protein
MKNYKINPAVAKFDFMLETSIQSLETEGFDFDNYHENTTKALDIDEEGARVRNYNEYSARIYLEGTPTNPETLVCWYNHQRNENTEKEETGDDEQTIKDIISILNNRGSIDNGNDLSVNKNGEYVPTFIEM